MTDEREPPTYFGAPPRGLATTSSFVARSGAHIRIFAGFLVRTTKAWALAAHRLMRLRVEKRRLETNRKRLQYELGGAAFAGDDDLVAVLREQLRGCAADLERNKTDMGAAVHRARDHTTDERSAAARTEIIPPDPDPGP